MALKVFHHYVVYFDNLSSIKQWLSDILCRACTGQGFTKRKLYTDEDSVIFQFRRCIGVNGIVLSELSPDFLDRSLTLTLKQIPSEKRRDERKLWKEFQEARPWIFGAILDILSRAMAIFPTVEIEHLPRMADFAMWGEAVARALGYEPSEFLETYREKIGEQVRDVLEENPIGLAILAFMENQIEWEGAPGELLEKLEDGEFVKEHKIDTNAEKWPGAANWVTKRIKEIETNLEHEGVKFRTKRVKGRRVITLKKVGLLDKIIKIKEWILENKDSDGLVDLQKLSAKINEIGLKPKEVVEKLIEEGFIFEVPNFGKWGVNL
jgi:hypothetical protein